jgi:golgi phosphoprotein 3
MENEETNTELSFLETIVLLALNDKGWFGNSEWRIKFGLAGAILFELEQSGKIEINGIVVTVKDSAETGNKVIDSALEVLSKSKKELTLKKAIQRIVYKSGLKWKSLLKNLIRKNILTKEEYRFLGIFFQDKYPLINIQVKKTMVTELCSKVMSGQELSAKELMLMAVMRTCRMIDKNFLLLEHFLKVRIKIKEITEFKEPLTETTRKIKDIQEAIRLAIMSSNVSIHN